MMVNGKNKALNCILSGAALVIISLLAVLFVEFEDKRVLLLLCPVPVFGVFQIFRGVRFAMNVPKKQPDEDHELKMTEYAEERHRLQNLHRKSSMKAEICSGQRKTGLLSFFICALLAFITPYDNPVVPGHFSFPVFGILFSAAGVIALIYGFSGRTYKKLVKKIKALGLDEQKVNEDFMGGELFKDKDVMFCAGNEYTVFVQENAAAVIPHSSVIKIYSVNKYTDIYAEGLVYADTEKSSYIVLKTAAGEYRLRYSDYLDKKAAEAYLNRIQFFTSKVFIFDINTV